jgi:hypothetical protein
VSLPAPFTPADCDLRDFAFMPLHVARLRSSEQNSDCTPEANWAALMLWAASWHEVPAGSIPDNDQWIAKACGYVSRGTVAAEWGTVRDGALRKFVKCEAGRLYHPTVCEQAVVGWAAKLRQRWRSECARIKKHNQRHGTNVSMPSYEDWEKTGRPVGQPLPEGGHVTGVPGDVPGDTASKGQGQGQGQLKENPSGSLPPTPRKRGKVGGKTVPEDFVVTAAMVQWASEHAPHADLKTETEIFRNWEFARPRTDWPKTWQVWMLKASSATTAGTRHASRAAGPSKHSGFADKNYREGVEADGSFT